MKYPATIGVALALVVGACADVQLNGGAPPPTDVSYSKLTTIVLGEDLNVVLHNRMKLASALESLGSVNIKPAGGKYIQRLRNALVAADMAGDANLPGLTGIDAIYGRAMLKAAKRKLNGAGKFKPKINIESVIWGKILDYNFDVSNPSSGDGRLKSVTYIKWVKTLPNGNKNEHTEAYRWTVKVNSGKYAVQTHSGDDEDPFPGTIQFPQAALDRIKLRGFNRKLWATGMDIVVELVEHDSNYTGGAGNFVQLNKMAAKNKNLYASTDESCIDMMFKIDTTSSGPGSFVPETMPQLLAYVADAGNGTPGYCLGRCLRPLLVNTGM